MAYVKKKTPQDVTSLAGYGLCNFLNNTTGPIDYLQASLRHHLTVVFLLRGYCTPRPYF